MNLQARIKGFVTLGHQLSDPNNSLLNDAKAEAYRQNAWFLPEFINQAIQQICQQLQSLDQLEQQIQQQIPAMSPYDLIDGQSEGYKPVI